MQYLALALGLVHPPNFDDGDNGYSYVFLDFDANAPHLATVIVQPCSHFDRKQTDQTVLNQPEL
jgi:hypothetical protein